MLQDIAIARACLKKGGEPDEEKAIKLLFDDFRSRKLGRVSLESPDRLNFHYYLSHCKSSDMGVFLWKKKSIRKCR